jgi:hypothetical protein
MANTKQAKKRAVQSVRRRERNRSVVTGVRHAVRDLRKAAAAGTGEAPDFQRRVGLDRAVRASPTRHRRPPEVSWPDGGKARLGPPSSSRGSSRRLFGEGLSIWSMAMSR